MADPGSRRLDIQNDPTGRAEGPKGNEGTSRGDPSIDEPQPPPSGGVELRSAAFTDHTLISDRYSVEGGNTSPPLEWTQAPAETEEFALVCEDPDAPLGTFVHWIVTGIPASASGIDEGALPQGAVAGRNDYGEVGWGGPRPPVGDEPHRYFFRLYSSDQPLGLGEGVGVDDLRAALEGHQLARGTLVGLFAR